MVTTSNDYQSNVRWFLEKPWKGNSPTGSVRAQLNTLQASLMRLFEDCVASKDQDLMKLSSHLFAEYQQAFQEGSPNSILALTKTLDRIHGVLYRDGELPGQWAAISASLKHAVVQLIELATTQRDEQLGSQVLDLARKLVPEHIDPTV